MLLSTTLLPTIQPDLNKLNATERNTHSSGVLIVNADDWGRDAETTDRILDCVLYGSVSSASGMVFMEDSERAALLAREKKVDVGLHLNFTSPFSDRKCPKELAEHQRRLAEFLLRGRYAQLVYHPGLANAFEYVVAAQIDEFRRIYDADPRRIDGHHHMHLCANVLVSGLLPRGIIIRRNFTFQSGEKSIVNRIYRKAIDSMLATRHRIVDYLFSLPPLEPPERIERIFHLARRSAVEVETHPVDPAEYRFLMDETNFSRIGGIQIARAYKL